MSLTTSKIKFVKVQGNWFADIPEYIQSGGDFSDCLMVAGAPELIEKLGGEGKETLTVEISTSYISGFHAVLNLEYKTYCGEESWGYYLATVLTSQINQNADLVTPFEIEAFRVGLCPVNSWVFGGEHPNSIYIKVPKNNED